MGARRVDRPALGAGPGRLVDEGGAPVDGGDGVGEVVGDGLEGAEGLVELLAVLGVLHRDVERLLGTPHGLGRRGGCSRRA